MIQLPREIKRRPRQQYSCQPTYRINKNNKNEERGPPVGLRAQASRPACVAACVRPQLKRALLENSLVFPTFHSLSPVSRPPREVGVSVSLILILNLSQVSVPNSIKFAQKKNSKKTHFPGCVFFFTWQAYESWATTPRFPGPQGSWSSEFIIVLLFCRLYLLLARPSFDFAR